VRLYVEAGADALFPEAMESQADFQTFASAFAGRVPLLANMTEFGKSPLLDFDDLAGMGYRMVLYPVTTLRSALKSSRETLLAIRDQGHQRDRLSEMLTRAELYQLLDYPGE